MTKRNPEMQEMQNMLRPLNEILEVGQFPTGGEFDLDSAPWFFDPEAPEGEGYLDQLDKVRASMFRFPKELRPEVEALCAEIIRLRDHTILDLDSLWSRLCWDKFEGKPKTKVALKQFLIRNKVKPVSTPQKGPGKRAFYILSEVKSVIRKKNK